MYHALARLFHATTMTTIVVLVAACPALFAAAEAVTGTWEVTMDLNGQKTFATLLINAKSDGTLAGTWGRSALLDVKFDGQKLTFSRTIKMGDQEFTTKYEGTLKDGRLIGAISSDRGQFPANGARVKPKPAILGVWEFKYTMGEREITGKLAITQTPDGALAGAWTSARGEHTVSNVEFKDNTLSFARKTKIEDREFESTYAGTLKGDALAGKFKSQRGEVEANAQRVGGALIGTWELTTTTDQGTRTSTLRICPDLTGRYELFGGELPIKDLKLEGNDVAFAVDMNFGQQSSTLTFKGTLDGKTLKGEVTSPRGTRAVTGKKLGSPAVGTWEFTRENPQGGAPRTSTLTINEDLTGSYTARDTTTAVQDLKVDGAAVSFKVTRTYNNQEVTMEFKGAVEGNELKGTFTSPRGTREAVGKKK
jgi:hypothetical protein